MEKKQDDNIVYISSKPFMNYVAAVVIHFRKVDTKELIIKARGKFTSRAIDVSEVAIRMKFLKDKNIKVTNVLTGSEEYTTNEGKKANVSIIEITLKCPP